MEIVHGTKIQTESAVLPFLDRYLKALSRQGMFEKDNIGLIGGSKEDLSLRDALQKLNLQEMLDIQDRERKSLYGKAHQCLFCLEYSPSMYLI